ncbi:hypothetical protein PN498_19060 [Oscillatoria sp. CS-180]|uniref:hypothetical protein n=1 Tax=Oscillatoria sp. CS-180 TaxID=3021720 RepID=UPI00232FB1C4|nr:hypothetical protein [Oscillatoria sp. CS-180]MDB9528102.1 hypothetical protein [Oscillatoria sp. CS-180]
MARYTTLFKAVSSLTHIRQKIADTLTSCDLNLVYENEDYLVAKEKPGGVKLAQLATVEVLINPPTVSDPSVRVDLIVQNQELPLKKDNHCYRLFEVVHQAMSNAPL